MDEMAFVRRVEESGTEEFAGILSAPTIEQEQVLRIYFGEDLYKRLRHLALRLCVSRERVAADPRGRNVVVIPGFMGCTLLGRTDDGRLRPIWLDSWELAQGAFTDLRLAPDGVSAVLPHREIESGRLLKRLYGALLLTLQRSWNVCEYDYDWRQDLGVSADGLLARVNQQFGPDQPFHIVAHSSGGLVARLFLRRHDRWRKAEGGRLIMLGVPNHGSFLATRILAGIADVVVGLDRLTPASGGCTIREVFNSFPAVYQFLPSPHAFRALEYRATEELYKPENYRPANVSKTHLDHARLQWESLADGAEIVPARTAYIAGYGRATVTGLKGRSLIDGFQLARGLADDEEYLLGFDGDGTVPLALGPPRGPDRSLLPSQIHGFRARHAALAFRDDVLNAVQEILRTGLYRPRFPDPSRDHPADPLSTKEDGGRLLIPEMLADRDDDEARKEWAASREIDARRFGHRAFRGPQPGGAGLVERLSTDRRDIERLLTRELGASPGDAIAHDPAAAFNITPTIRFNLRHGEIHDERVYDQILMRRRARLKQSLPVSPATENDQAYPVDVIAIAHYIGEYPSAARGLDQAVSRVLDLCDDLNRSCSESRNLLIDQLIRRGAARGNLAQCFILPDPRPNDVGRLIVLVGMGYPGRFGEPELAVLARELAWTVGRLGRRHLAIGHVGTRNKNLSASETLAGWIRGCKAALTGSNSDYISEVSFILDDPRVMRDVDRAILAQRKLLTRRMTLRYDPLDDEQLLEADEASRQRNLQEWQDQTQGRGDGHASSRGSETTQVTLTAAGGVYRFGAVLKDASIPEREIPLDPRLVERANDELAAEADPAMQLERGLFLTHLLFPREFLDYLRSDSPLVMTLDSTTARIHWEMAAQRDAGPDSHDEADSSRIAGGEFRASFLGRNRSLTRQLRSTFAPPPDAPPPPRRRLRVMVIADPAENAPLAGAQREGVEVADLFDAFNTLHARDLFNSIEVVRLIGPREASRTNVLRELINRTYDVLHYAGHCFHDPKNNTSGWIFGKDEFLTANELRRIDRVPKFVFSNACESGITADRSESRSAALAPTFAESFFERGVSNFICTAWPVGDEAALLFALTLYGKLLGIRLPDQHGDDPTRADEGPLPIHEAMREARKVCASMPGAQRTWGAYQHYGHPYFTLFDRFAWSDQAKPKSDPKPPPPPARSLSERSSRPKRKPKSPPQA